MTKKCLTKLDSSCKESKKILETTEIRKEIRSGKRKRLRKFLAVSPQPYCLANSEDKSINILLDIDFPGSYSVIRTKYADV